MSIQTKALLRYLVLIALLIGLAFTSRWSDTALVGFGLAIAFTFASALVWPRCPHCQARVVQFNKREWVPGLRCWRCGRVYDEDETAPYIADVMDAAEWAEKLRKKDPAAADRLMADAEARAEAAAAKERAELREQAPRDLRAALRLRTRLQSELRGFARTRRNLERNKRTDPRAEIGLQNITKWEHSLRDEIASIDVTIQRLTADEKRSGRLTSA